MSIVWLDQILALKYTKKNLENSENRGCHGNGGENQHFFTFVFITQYKLKMGKVSEKSIFLFPSYIERCLIFSESDS